MERIGDLTNIQVIGGSAGDDLAFSKTFVYLDGNAYTNTAVFAILEPKKDLTSLKPSLFVHLGINSLRRRLTQPPGK